MPVFMSTVQPEGSWFSIGVYDEFSLCAYLRKNTCSILKFGVCGAAAGPQPVRGNAALPLSKMQHKHGVMNHSFESTVPWLRCQVGVITWKHLLTKASVILFQDDKYRMFTADCQLLKSKGGC